MEIKHIDLAREGTLLPPPPGTCHMCAVAHSPGAPHNQQGLHWNYWFYRQHGRWPTWADAMAHCSDEVKKATIEVLKEAGAWKNDGDENGN